MASDAPQNTGRKRPTGKKSKPLSQKEQSERFKETARYLAADETGEAFERAVGIIIKPKDG